MTDTVTIFNDGSLEARVLKYELLKGYGVVEIPVDKYTKLEDWVNKLELDDNKIDRVFLHFPFEDYTTTDIRTEMMELSRKHPSLRLVPYYEQTDRSSLQHRAANYGIKDTKPIAITIAEPTQEIDLKDVAKHVVTEAKFGSGGFTVPIGKHTTTVAKEFTFTAEKPKKKRKYF